MTDLITRCEDYLLQRTGKYQWRRVRYRAVIDKMLEHDLSDHHLLVDVGAGWTEFDYTLRTEELWRGRYWAVDGQFDGTDLEHWVPPRRADWFVAIELIEHLDDPFRLLQEMKAHADKGVVITTPNPHTTDVLGMDHTHKTEVWPEPLRIMGFKVEERSFYGQHDDSLLAWWTR